ncbi:hypothetical protein CRUP_002236 [Coryphaenoides rupestris]|nr:hypothetical protein CRUP_002236 [Coryphaenoides rupestris]
MHSGRREEIKNDESVEYHCSRIGVLHAGQPAGQRQQQAHHLVQVAHEHAELVQLTGQAGALHRGLHLAAQRLVLLHVLPQAQAGVPQHRQLLGQAADQPVLRDGGKDPPLPVLGREPGSWGVGGPPARVRGPQEQLRLLGEESLHQVHGGPHAPLVQDLRQRPVPAHDVPGQLLPLGVLLLCTASSSSSSITSSFSNMITCPSGSDGVPRRLGLGDAGRLLDCGGRLHIREGGPLAVGGGGATPLKLIIVPRGAPVVAGSEGAHHPPLLQALSPKEVVVVMAAVVTAVVRWCPPETRAGGRGSSAGLRVEVEVEVEEGVEVRVVVVVVVGEEEETLKREDEKEWGGEVVVEGSDGGPGRAEVEAVVLVVVEVVVVVSGVARGGRSVSLHGSNCGEGERRATSAAAAAAAMLAKEEEESSSGGGGRRSEAWLEPPGRATAVLPSGGFWVGPGLGLGPGPGLGPGLGPGPGLRWDRERSRDSAAGGVSASSLALGTDSWREVEAAEEEEVKEVEEEAEGVVSVSGAGPADEGGAVVWMASWEPEIGGPMVVVEEEEVVEASVRPEPVPAHPADHTPTASTTSTTAASSSSTTTMGPPISGSQLAIQTTAPPSSAGPAPETETTPSASSSASFTSSSSAASTSLQESVPSAREEAETPPAAESLLLSLSHRSPGPGPSPGPSPGPGPSPKPGPTQDPPEGSTAVARPGGSSQASLRRPPPPLLLSSSSFANMAAAAADIARRSPSPQFEPCRLTDRPPRATCAAVAVAVPIDNRPGEGSPPARKVPVRIVQSESSERQGRAYLPHPHPHAHLQQQHHSHPRHHHHHLYHHQHHRPPTTHFG